jgi:hypothetical protein
MDPIPPATPPDSPLTLQDVVASPLYRDLLTPKLREGEPAFPFTLPRLDLRDGVPRPTGETVSLAEFRGRKPVALVFGSYT